MKIEINLTAEELSAVLKELEMPQNPIRIVLEAQGAVRDIFTALGLGIKQADYLNGNQQTSQ
jgi:hypothetical protein